MKKFVDRILQNETLNFWLTNRIPRRAFTLFMGWFSKIENPWLARLSIVTWQFFADDLKLEEAKKNSFRSLHDCFIRELKAGARPIDPEPSRVASPCDAIVGAMGVVNGTELVQAKGYSYTLEDLLDSAALAEQYRNGWYFTLRLKSSMYHRFHAPCNCKINHVNYISGDVWNVNPIALRRVERLFCKNERAVIPLATAEFGDITLVPVAAILVASINLNFLDVTLNLKYPGPNHITCQASFNKGDEMGYFQHGSTIIVLATSTLRPCPWIQPGDFIKVGQPLFQRNAHSHLSSA